MNPIGSIAVFMAFAQAAQAGDDGGSGLAPYRGRIIRHVEIVRKNVFEDRTGRSAFFLYRWADALHVVTRERVIRQELLFAPGDSLDAEPVLESQRNIRGTGLIEDVIVTAEPAGADSVDLTVVTGDLWTTNLSPTFETGGGNSKLGIFFSEKNFLGTGQLIEVDGETGTDQSGVSLRYSNPRLGGSRIGVSAGYTDYTYQEYYLLQLDKPRYALTVHSRYSAGFSVSRGATRLFEGGIEYFRYDYEKDAVRAEAAHSFGTRGRIDLIAAYEYDRREYREDAASPTTRGAIPPSETLSYPALGIAAAYTRFGVERYLDEAGTPEDLTYGPAAGIEAGRSWKGIGADYASWNSTVSARLLAKPFPRVIVGAADGVSWQAFQGASRRIHNVAEGFLYVKTARTQVLAFHALADFAWREVPSYQVLLGGDTGLRGYRYFALSGERLALGNVEYRYYSSWEILTVRIGGAAFYDVGNVWRRGETIDLSRMKSDIGIGLRFGLSKSTTSRTVSVDLARALSEPRWFVTISSGLVFSLASLGT